MKVFGKLQFIRSVAALAAAFVLAPVLANRPDNYLDIVAPPHTPVMFRSNDDGAFVWLTIRPSGVSSRHAAPSLPLREGLSRISR